MSSTDLERRLEKLECVEAIKNLKAQYARHCDNGYPPDRIAELYAENGIWEGDRDLGVAEGRQAIRDFFTGVSDVYTWAQHYTLTPLIEVDDDLQHAQGSWYLFMPYVLTVDGVSTARWMAGYYDDTYVRIDGVWKVQHSRFHQEVNTSYATGWVPDRFTS
jgi:hypothetical protein